MGVQKAPYQKTYELQIGAQDFTVDFQGAKRQFDWMEISLVRNIRPFTTVMMSNVQAK